MAKDGLESGHDSVGFDFVFPASWQSVVVELSGVLVSRRVLAKMMITKYTSILMQSIGYRNSFSSNE